MGQIIHPHAVASRCLLQRSPSVERTKGRPIGPEVGREDAAASSVQLYFQWVTGEGVEAAVVGSFRGARNLDGRQFFTTHALCHGLQPKSSRGLFTPPTLRCFQTTRRTIGISSRAFS